MRTTRLLIFLLPCIASFSATTRPADIPVMPGLALFVQAEPIQHDKQASVVFEITNKSSSEMHVDYRINFARDYPNLSDEQAKMIKTSDGTWYDGGTTYMVGVHLSAPLPREQGEFIPRLDLRFVGHGDWIAIAPGGSLLKRIDLPKGLRFQGHCEIYVSLIQQKHEVVRSETAKFDVTRN